MELHKSVFFNSLAFFGLAAILILGLGLEIWPLVLMTKPLMLILLSVWFFFSSRRYGDRFTLLIQAGLFFFLVGDIALLFSQRNEFNFLLGLGAHLIAVFVYGVSFLNNVFEMRSRKRLTIPAVICVLVISASLAYYSELYPNLHEMLYPVSGYGAILALMCCAAAFRFGKTYKKSFWAILLGTFLLWGSNALLGYDRFVHDLSGATMFITALYAIGQYLIVRGALKHIERPGRRNRPE